MTKPNIVVDIILEETETWAIRVVILDNLDVIKYKQNKIRLHEFEAEWLGTIDPIEMRNRGIDMVTYAREYMAKHPEPTETE